MGRLALEDTPDIFDDPGHIFLGGLCACSDVWGEVGIGQLKQGVVLSDRFGIVDIDGCVGFGVVVEEGCQGGGVEDEAS